ncbi:hypothetical protein NDU88_002838 [Pleurodeles waltl]|uniref:Uncharacterized protein n=1 Tax=Pleurodeles waltl TaxID=8319 RepID=A0AAV7TMX0_PLEWA|nr:hypothetical protein NDU88_002838 [Pleurodeles waltl]
MTRLRPPYGPFLRDALPAVRVSVAGSSFSNQELSDNKGAPTRVRMIISAGAKPPPPPRDRRSTELGA